MAHGGAAISPATQTGLVLSGPTSPRFTRGDFNADGEVNIADAVSILVYLFGGGGTAPCGDAADANDDGAIDIGDGLRVLSHLFGARRPLPEPFGRCAPDTTGDGIGCSSYPPCAAP
jgi:hypothetical protein